MVREMLGGADDRITPPSLTYLEFLTNTLSHLTGTPPPFSPPPNLRMKNKDHRSPILVLKG